jgi:hypothetical protein
MGYAPEPGEQAGGLTPIQLQLHDTSPRIGLLTTRRTRPEIRQRSDLINDFKEIEAAPAHFFVRCTTNATAKNGDLRYSME